MREVVQVPVRELRMGENIRKELNVGGLKDSVAEEGILSPILVYRNPAGQLTVLDGHRRLQAAMQAGLDVVPTVEVEPTERDRDIMRQLVLNEAREDLSETDRVEAVRQLVLFGVDASMIAKKTGRPKPKIEELVSVANSDPVMHLLKDEQLSFDLALQMVTAEEKDGVDIGVLSKLVEDQIEKNPGEPIEAWRFRGLVHQAKAQTELKKKRLELEAQGLRVVEAVEDPDERASAIDELGLEPDEHEDCPGRFFYVDVNIYGANVVVEEWCEDFEKYGHSVKIPDYSEEERQRREEARLEREKRLAEKQAASEARQEFVANLLKAPNPPKGWEKLVVYQMTSHPGSFNKSFLGFVAEALGIQTEGVSELPDAIYSWADNNPTKSWQAVWGCACAYGEDTFFYEESQKSVLYLAALWGWGHRLSPFEIEAVDCLTEGEDAESQVE